MKKFELDFCRNGFDFCRKGLLAFGTVDDRNIFHLLPRIDGRFVDWKLLRSLDISNTVPRHDTSKTQLTDDSSKAKGEKINPTPKYDEKSSNTKG